MNTELALAAIACHPTTLGGRAGISYSCEIHKGVLVPGKTAVNRSPFTSGNVASSRKVHPFWDLVRKSKVSAGLIGNGLPQQLGYDTSSRNIRAQMVAQRPHLYQDPFAIFPPDTELEQLMQGMSDEGKQQFRHDMANALNHIMGKVEKGRIRAKRFISVFSNVFTLNYDPLLPLLFEHATLELGPRSAGLFDDGTLMYGNLGAWLGTAGQNWHYPHGSIVLFKSENGELIVKVALQVFRNKLSVGELCFQLRVQPMMILDAHADAKMDVIMQDSYLLDSLLSLGEITGDLFVYGLGLNKETDRHIWTLIDNADLDNIYIGVKEITDELLENVKDLLPQKHGIVKFFDRDSI